MKCKKCGQENGDLKKTCTSCGAFLEGYAINNVTGKLGYRGSDGYFYESEAQFYDKLKNKYFIHNQERNKTMRFKGTIVITDPCYVDEKNRIENCINESTIYGDWSCFTYIGTIEQCQDEIAAWISLYLDFYQKYNFSGLSEEVKSNLLSTYKADKRAHLESNCYGEFCADSGRVGVYLMEDIVKCYPEKKEWIKQHPWCATVIEDFDGEVEYVVDDGAHIVGKGNKPFWTSQSGF